MTRRLLAVVLGVAFLGSHFVLFPAFAIALNTSWGWPRWRSAASEGVGIVLGLAAVAALVHCATMFRSIGRGTPQPLAPPTRLVAAGLYQYSRNPIYAADVALLLAVFLVRGDVMLLLYTLVVTVECTSGSSGARSLYYGGASGTDTWPTPSGSHGGCSGDGLAGGEYRLAARRLKYGFSAAC